MKFTSLFSGSDGNSYLLETEECKILIDAGKSGKKIINELQKLNINISSISAFILTHEHTDHIKSFFMLSKKYNIPVYFSKQLLEKIEIKTNFNLVNTFSSSKTFKIFDIHILPLKVSHDAIDPLSFIFKKGRSSIGIFTDLGNMDKDTLEKIKKLDSLLLESNYDESLIQYSPYPYYLKKRISSDKGHLSNSQMKEILSFLENSKIKNIILGHISNNSNDSNIVLKIAENEINRWKNKNINISIAPREQKGETIII